MFRQNGRKKRDRIEQTGDIRVRTTRTARRS